MYPFFFLFVWDFFKNVNILKQMLGNNNNKIIIIIIIIKMFVGWLIDFNSSFIWSKGKAENVVRCIFISVVLVVRFNYEPAAKIRT